MQCSKKRSLFIAVQFSTDENAFCDSQEFFQVSFQTLKLTSKHVIGTLMLIIMYIQVIIVCYILVIFS